MTKDKGLPNLSLKMKNYNSIFGETQASNSDIIMLPINSLVTFPDHPFKLYSGEKLDKLIESIRELGILNPILVRKADDGTYQNLSGHNRVNAAGIIGLKEVPCIIKNVDFDTAVQIVVDSNLRQRDSLLPSEKAFAYKMKLEAMNRQGKRENNSDVIKKSRELVGEELGDSGTQVQRYIRLTNLIPSILDLTDEGKIPLNTAVELSYLSHEGQELLYQLLSENCTKIKLSQAIQLKNISRENNLTAEVITAVLESLNLEKSDYMKLPKIPKSKFTQYFKDYDKDEEVLEVIMNALDMYFSNL